MSSSETKRCPFCDEEIKAVATIRRFCGEDLEDERGPLRRKSKSPGTVDRMLLPVGRPVSAIAAGYCGLIGIVPMCGLPFSIAAVVCGIVALGTIGKNPELSGKGRAWFGIILGLLATLFSLFLLVILSIAPKGHF
jgi:hypothetical protein